VLSRLVIFLVLANPLIRYVVGASAVLVALTFTYFKGRSDCAVKQAGKRAEAAERWAASVADDLEAAYQRGAESARIDAENDDKVKEIPREDEVNASHILVDGEEKAKEVLGKVEKGEDFSKLAEEYSSDPGSKANGGKLGYFGKGQMVKEFETAAFALKKGEVSKPVQSKFGWHIIKIEDRREKPLPTYEQVKDQILDSMVQQKGQQVAQELRGKAEIDYVDPEIREEVRKETAMAAARKKMQEQQFEEQIKQMENKGGEGEKPAGEAGKAD